MSTLVRSAPIRLCARGPSGTLTASTPASLSFRTSATMREPSTPRGGTISTDVTNSPAAMREANRDRSGNGVASGGWRGGGGVEERDEQGLPKRPVPVAPHPPPLALPPRQHGGDQPRPPPLPPCGARGPP